MDRHLLVSNVMRSIVIFIVFFVNVESVPPEYCLHPLNTSDCNLPPTPVFSYYKSGSRCEIEVWRGCPTYNKFPNQYECVDTCIFHYSARSVEFVYFSAEQPTYSIEEDLKELSVEDLGQLEEIVEEVAEEVKKLKFVENVTEEVPPEPTEAPETPEPETEPAATKPEATEPEATKPEATEPKATEPPLTEAPTTKKESDESGLPDEVEMP